MTGEGLTGTVAVEGVGDLLRAFGSIDKGLRRELRLELLDVANIAAGKARAIAEQKGLHATGALIDRIHAGARASYAYITDTARRASPAYPQGFNYPAVYEYGHGGARAFLTPAAITSEDDVISGVESLLDRLTRAAGLQKGGLL